jgi:hypothetical protein
MDVICIPCPVCGERSALTGVDALGYLQWDTFGANVQDALPGLDPDQRELLVSGTHAHCWDRLHGGAA